MKQTLIQTVRLTQILINEGWLFQDKGYNRIYVVSNDSMGEEHVFHTDEAFENWMIEQQKRLDL